MQARKVVFAGPGKVALETFEASAPAEDQILIETLYSSISPGTERAHLLVEFGDAALDMAFRASPRADHEVIEAAIVALTAFAEKWAPPA